MKDKSYFNHNSHVIISILAHESNLLNRFLIFSKLIVSIFNNTESFGFYYGDANKLFDKNQILDKEEILKRNKLPIDLWVNFIVDSEKEYNSLFTNGLSKFNKLEIEVIKSSLDLDTMYKCTYDIVHYMLLNNEELKNNDSIGYGEENKIRIGISEGVYVPRQSVKLIIENFSDLSR